MSLVCLFIILVLAPTDLGIRFSEIVQVHRETNVLDSALAIASKDLRITELLGELEPLGNLAILEGSHRYTNAYNRLEITVDVHGAKSGNSIRGKMDVLVDKKDKEWVFKTIDIRVKKPLDLKQTIHILNATN